MSLKVEPIFKQTILWGIAIIVLAFSIAISALNPLLFHLLIELFTITIAGVIASFVFTTRKKIDNPFFLFVGVVISIISIFDLAHTVSYKGMNIVNTQGANLATQLWVAARYLHSIGFLIAAALVKQKWQRISHAVYGFIGLAVILGLSIAYGIFPDCYIEGAGLTTFKIISEYAIIFLFGFSGYLLFKNRSRFDKNIFRLLLWSLVFIILGELAFTFYVSVFGLSNIIGHVFKLLSYLFLYTAIIIVGINNPYKLLFQNLTSTQKRLRLKDKVVDNAKEGIFITGPNGDVLLINNAFMDLTGYQRRKNIQDYPFFEDWHHNCNNCGPMEAWHGEIELEKKNKEKIFVSINCQPVYNEEGEVTNYFGVFSDITKQKFLEMRLVEERQLLNEKVKDQTEALQQKNHELIHTMQVKDKFVASMSHELRTPLTAILGMSDMLCTETVGPLNERQARYMQTINQSGTDLLLLINDILDEAKINAEEMDLNLAPYAIDDVCQNCYETMKPLAEKKEIKFSLSIEDNIGAVNTDHQRVKQILLNLLNNAVKFTPEGGQIVFDVKRLNQHVQFDISDTGIGIPEEKKAIIFQPFTQIDSDLSRAYSGTGLGLALAKNFTELLGGHIQVESEVGKGSSFIVTIPINIEENEFSKEPDLEEVDVLEAETEIFNSKKEQILIVEDDENSRTLFSELLSTSGFQVSIAKDGLEALSHVATSCPDLILMDIQMPKMDGLKCIKQIRAISSVEDPPIIALTALASEEDEKRCLAAGATLFMSKPVNLKKLLREVFRLTDENSSLSNST